MQRGPYPLPVREEADVNAVAAQRMGTGDGPVTAGGPDQLRSELEVLRTDGRRQMSERLREARARHQPAGVSGRGPRMSMLNRAAAAIMVPMSGGVGGAPAGCASA